MGVFISPILKPVAKEHNPNIYINFIIDKIRIGTASYQNQTIKSWLLTLLMHQSSRLSAALESNSTSGNASSDSDNEFHAPTSAEATDVLEESAGIIVGQWVVVTYDGSRSDMHNRFTI